VTEKENYQYEIITAVDGSPDKVGEVLLERAESNSRIKVIILSKNYGQASAQMVGIKHASGDYVVLLDDDGQCPVDRVFDLISPLEVGYDIAVAKYRKKTQSAFKNFGSVVNKKTTHFLLDVNKDFELSNFLAMKRFVAVQISSYNTPYPFIDGFISQITKNIMYVPMEERNRMKGKTGYTLTKLVGLWLNGFTSFSVKPLRISSLIGVICAFAGFIFGIITIIRKLTLPDIDVGWSSIVSIIIFIGGLIMLMLGMIGEYLGRVYISINKAPQYVVRETKNISENNNEK
jgi:undecaprenyl-phosphate 4-deoxy-4-formamido-L-arabinose transferase